MKFDINSPNRKKKNLLLEKATEWLTNRDKDLRFTGTGQINISFFKNLKRTINRTCVMRFHTLFDNRIIH